MLLAIPMLALGCSPARQQSTPPQQYPPPMIGAMPAALPNEASPVQQASAAYPIVPHHSVTNNSGQRPVSPRRYPIAVAPLRSYGCCH
jgi:hypothetical protein